MDPLHHNAALAFADVQFIFTLLRGFQHLLVCQFALVVLRVNLQELVDDLAFLQTAVSYSRQYGIPVTETVFFHNGFQVFGLCQISQSDAF